jgi:hypothetical protein
MEAFFQSPVAFDEANLNSVANNALEKFGKYNLRAPQIWQKVGDQLFDYELSFGLFNNQAQVRLGAERLFVNLQSARGKKDVEIVAECLVSASQCVTAGAFAKSTVQAVAHAAFDSEISGELFFASFVDKDKAIIGGGNIVVVQESSWPSPVRLACEKSLLVKNAVFLTWFMERTGTVDLEALKEIADKFGVSVQRIGLEFGIE